jgi:hypothetical protein
MCVYAPQVPVSVEGIKRQGPGVQLGTASSTNSDGALTSPATANGHSSANRSSAKSSLFTVRLCLASSCSGEVGPVLLLCLPYGAFARSAVGSSAPARARLAAEPLGQAQPHPAPPQHAPPLLVSRPALHGPPCRLPVFLLNAS